MSNKLTEIVNTEKNNFEDVFSIKMTISSTVCNRSSFYYIMRETNDEYEYKPYSQNYISSKPLPSSGFRHFRQQIRLAHKGTYSLTKNQIPFIYDYPISTNHGESF